MIPVDIITGFLGAGKTTLINKLLNEAYSGELPIVIENEFGETGVDDSLIENKDIQVRLLSSGCICCTLMSDFVEGLAEVAQLYEPSHIIVEPTGLANPLDLLEACEEAALRVPIEVRTLITVVNAENIIPLLSVGGKIFHTQISKAETILLSHIKDLSFEELEEVKCVLREYSPEALILENDWDSIDSLELLACAEEVRSLRIRQRVSDVEHDGAHEARNHKKKQNNSHGSEGDVHSCPQPGSGNSTSQFKSLSFFPEQRFSDNQIEGLLSSLSEGACGNVLRAKGFLRKNDDSCCRVDYVYGRSEIYDTNYNGEAKFIVIGTGLEESKITALFEGGQDG